jgi:hypothetical protein
MEKTSALQISVEIGNTTKTLGTFHFGVWSKFGCHEGEAHASWLWRTGAADPSLRSG